jgi:hypothetical protein
MQLAIPFTDCFDFAFLDFDFDEGANQLHYSKKLSINFDFYLNLAAKSGDLVLPILRIAFCFITGCTGSLGCFSKA